MIRKNLKKKNEGPTFLFRLDPVNHVAGPAHRDILSWGRRGLPRGGQFSRCVDCQMPTEGTEKWSEGRREPGPSGTEDSGGEGFGENPVRPVFCGPGCGEGA